MIKERRNKSEVKFDYRQTIKALPLTFKPSIILPEVTNPVKQTKLDPEEESFLQNEHAVYCQMLGYLSLGDKVTQNIFSGYVPKNEKVKQLTDANKKKKVQLIQRWGLSTDDEGNSDGQKEKLLLRHGEIKYEFMKTACSTHSKICELARDIALGTKAIRATPGSEKDGGSGSTKQQKSKLKLKRLQMKKEKIMKDQRKMVERKHKSAETVVQMSKEKSAAIFKAAKEIAEIDAFKKFNKLPKGKSITGPGIKTASDESSAVYVNIGDSSAEKKQKKKLTVEELKEELKTQVEKKKMFTTLHSTGKDDLLKDVKVKQGWEEAARKVEGKRFDSVDRITRELKKVEHKKKKSGKKLKEVLKRQQQGKHKRLVRKQQNLRSRRVTKLASKMNKLQKRGTIVPTFMC